MVVVRALITAAPGFAHAPDERRCPRQLGAPQRIRLFDSHGATSQCLESLGITGFFLDPRDERGPVTQKRLMAHAKRRLSLFEVFGPIAGWHQERLAAGLVPERVCGAQ